MLTIVMYHYVRDLPRTRFPRIKGLRTDLFEGQLDYVAQNHTVCSLSTVVAAVRGEAELPRDACVLTFDDGFADHYHTVFPRLDERGMVGGFFPPAQAIEEGRVLDVHKIHHVLAVIDRPQEVIEEIFAALRPHRAVQDLPEDDVLYEEFARPGKYDPPEVMFMKRILQRGLPPEVRADLTDTLFRKYVSQDEAAFASELYMDPEQLRCMARHGMEIGGHGYAHVWLETLSEDAQAAEIEQTTSFLTKILGCPPTNWTMCYPYGSYNETTVRLVRHAGAALGLTTRVDVADLTAPFEMARLDTNYLPCTAGAPGPVARRGGSFDPVATHRL